jgi:hypothetical protein
MKAIRVVVKKKEDALPARRRGSFRAVKRYAMFEVKSRKSGTGTKTVAVIEGECHTRKKGVSAEGYRTGSTVFND